ncbi:uncharacterized [Tachysurus ichikawai]
MKLRSLELACAMIDWKGGPSHPERKAIYVVLDSKPNHSLMFLMLVAVSRFVRQPNLKLARPDHHRVYRKVRCEFKRAASQAAMPSEIHPSAECLL